MECKSQEPRVELPILPGRHDFKSRIVVQDELGWWTDEHEVERFGAGAFMNCHDVKEASARCVQAPVCGIVEYVAAENRCECVFGAIYLALVLRVVRSRGNVAHAENLAKQMEEVYHELQFVVHGPFWNSSVFGGSYLSNQC